MLQSILEESALDTSRTEGKDTRRPLQARASRRTQARSPEGRRIHNLVIEDEDPDGVLYPSQDRAADALREFWGPRFRTASGISDGAASHFLDESRPLNVARRVRLGAGGIAEQRPGLDGLRFSCRRCAGPDAARVLHVA